MKKLKEENAIIACLEPEKYSDFYFEYEHTIVHTGSPNASRQLAKKYNIQHFELFRNGGCIITSPEDFAVIFVYNEEKMSTESQKFYQYIINKSLEYGIILEIDSNDLIFKKDNQIFKLAGAAEGHHRGVFYTVIHISTNVNYKLIEEVCGKKTKTPMGFNSLISKEIVEQWIQEYERN